MSINLSSADFWIILRCASGLKSSLSFIIVGKSMTLLLEEMGRIYTTYQGLELKLENFRRPQLQRRQLLLLLNLLVLPLLNNQEQSQPLQQQLEAKLCLELKEILLNLNNKLTSYKITIKSWIKSVNSISVNLDLLKKWFKKMDMNLIHLVTLFSKFCMLEKMKKWISMLTVIQLLVQVDNKSFTKLKNNQTR